MGLAPAALLRIIAATGESFREGMVRKVQLGRVRPPSFFRQGYGQETPPTVAGAKRDKPHLRQAESPLQRQPDNTETPKRRTREYQERIVDVLQRDWKRASPTTQLCRKIRNI